MEAPIANWAADLSNLIHAFADLAWPVMVGLLAWALKGELPELMRRVRLLRVGSAEAHLDPRLLEATSAKVETDVRQQLPRGGSTRDTAEQHVMETAAQNVGLALVALVIELEWRVRNLASVSGHEDPQREAWTRLTWWLVDRGIVPKGVASAADMIREARNRAAHGQDMDASLALTALDAGLRLLRVLSAIPSDGYEVRDLVDVYVDPDATEKYSNCQGVVLWDFDANGKHRDYRVYPTTLSYAPGQRVGWQWSFDRTFGEAYWRDPWDGNVVKLGWSESAEFVGQPLRPPPADPPALPNRD